MLDLIDKHKIPSHVAIIMDGNGRWAKERDKDRLFGHQHGVISVKEVVEGCAEIGIKYLTLYAFSTENWNRPENEVKGLMELLVATIRKEAESLNKNGVRLWVIGDLDCLPENCKAELLEATELTKDNTKLNVILALSYSSKWEITNAVKQIAEKIKNNELQVDDINEEVFASFLTTKNFLLYQMAYSELYFTHTHWPDFRKKNLYEAILNFQNRERRFGKISEQLY
jgi:undecaprenyl diphosphate synthase